MSRFQKLALRLRPRAPVHVGCGKRLNKDLDFFIRRGDPDNTLWVLAEDRLLFAAKRAGKLLQLTELLRRNTGAGEIVRQIGAEPDDVAAYAAPVAHGFAPREIVPFVRDPFHRPYLPGSSFKGALRTALLWRTQAAAPTAFQQYAASMPEHLSANRAKFFAQDLEKQHLAARAVKARGRDFEARTAQNRDWLRCIKVSDSTPMDPDSLVLHQVHLFSHGSNRAADDRIPFGYECWPPDGDAVTLSLTFDEALHRAMAAGSAPSVPPFAGLDDALQAVRDYSAFVWEEERQASQVLRQPGVVSEEYESFYGKGAPAVRLGWGSGLLSCTLDGLLAPEERAAVLRKLGRGGGASPVQPKSRRVAADRVDGRDIHLFAPLGWVDVT
jgi:CRISPR-associated protein Csm5